MARIPKRILFLLLAVAGGTIILSIVGWVWIRTAPGAKKSPVLGLRVLGSVPELPGGVEIEESAVLLSRDDGRNTYLNGVKAALSEVRGALGRPPDGVVVNTQPVLLEVAPVLSVADLNDLLELLIVKAQRTNIAFLVSTPDGPRSITLPILVCHGCDCLLFHDGNYCHDEHEKPLKHLWLRGSPARTGAIDVSSVTINMTACAVVEEEVSSVTGSEEADELRGSPTTFRMGIWTAEEVRAFVKERRPDEPSVFVHLDVGQDDGIADVLLSLANLKAAVGRRVVVAIRTASLPTRAVSPGK